MATILAERGVEILAAEGPQPVQDLIDGLPEHLRTRDVRRLSEQARSLAESGRLLAEARYDEALAAAQQAATLVAGDPVLRGTALEQCGQALTRLGRLDAAADHLNEAITHRRTASALCLRGDVHRIRGEDGSAESAYREALRRNPDHTPARAGLAELLADSELAGPSTPLAMARVALATGDRVRAAALARQATELAVTQQDRAALAEALELTAATADRATARRALTEARAIWRAAGAVLDEARVTVRLGERPEATTAQRIEARRAREALAAKTAAAPTTSPVEVRTLGRFEVTVEGQPVPPATWQSRKARDLLRILVVRRGRGIPREELAALLWQDDNAAKVSHRLSVALSTVRTALDPEKRWPSDHYVQATQASIALNQTHLSTDLEDFLTEADHGFRNQDRQALEHAESLYTGDVFEDEPYDDWLAPLREQARATYLRVARTLSELHSRAGNLDCTVHYLHRLLSKDPYDEQAHRDLIATLDTAGCHGEARRARARHTTAMRTVA